MRVWSVGAGAVGGCVAARLHDAGADVSILDANADHVRIVTTEGLRVDGIGGGTRTVLREVSFDEQPDVVLLAVRSSSTASALDRLSPHLTATTDVVSLQNGLNEDGIASAIGPHRTIGCVVGFGATWIANGHISLDANGDLTIGRLGRSSDERLDAVRALLQNAFPTSITDNVRGALWAKMLVNSMTVLGALGGMLTGELLSTGERRRLVADVIAEGVRVAHAEGVELPKVLGAVAASSVDGADWPALMEAALVRTRERFGAIKSVTWRDFELGRKTEIDAVTGEIVVRGARAGVPTPISSAVYAMLREIEAGERAPDAANLDLVVTAAG